MASKRPIALLSLPTPLRQSTCFQCQSQIRGMHAPKAAKSTPKPTPFVPDVPSFLTLIGRNMSQHAAKIPSWDALFKLSSQELREAGVEPSRARRYLLWWRNRYRNGLHGPGGDFKYVQDGVAELRILDTPNKAKTATPATINSDYNTLKRVYNVPPTVALPHDPANPRPDEEAEKDVLQSLAPPKAEKERADVRGFKVVRGSTISGPYVETIKGLSGVARLRVQEGLWEQKRGQKVDGGERRKAAVRAKRRAEERKNAR